MVQPDLNPVPDLIKQKRTESVKTISLLGALGSWVAVVAYLFARLQTSDSRYIIVAILATIMAIALSTANFLANRNRDNLAIWLSILAPEIIFFIISFIVADLGLILAVILSIFVISLSWQMFSSRMTIIALISGGIASSAILLVDVLPINPAVIVPPEWLPESTIVAGGIITLLLGMDLLRNYPFNSIRSQVVVVFVTISVIPLLTVVAPQLIATSSLLQTNTNQALSDKASELSNSFDNQLKYLLNINANNANVPTLVKFVQNNGTETPQDVLEYFQTLKDRNPDVVAYILLDKNGRILLNTRTASVNNPVDKNLQNISLQTVQHKQSSISDISFDLSTNKRVFYISSPIITDGNVQGVLCTELDANFLQRFFEQVLGNQNEEKGTTALLIDQNGIILANSSSPQLRFVSLTPLKQTQLAALQQQKILSAGTAEDLSTGFAELQRNIDQSIPNFEASLTPNGEKSATTQRSLTSKDSWKIIVGWPLSTFSGLINIQIGITVLVATIVMLIALMTAVITSNLLTLPINYLTNMAERVRRHESDASVKLDRRDEIGRLSETINANAEELRQILATIENRIEERTVNLSATTEDVKRQTSEFRSIVEITRKISAIQNLDELLPEISTQISTRFGFYHVGIFLTDQTGQYAVLQASNSPGGRKMMERNYRVKVGQSNIIGFVIGSGQYRIASDVGEDAITFDNPDLPDTRSQIILPLQKGEIIFGALDLQSSEVSAFNVKDVDTLSVLADQISIAIENARSFDEIRAALEEAQLFYQQSATTSWREVLRQGMRGYRYINGSVEVIKHIGELPKKTGAGSADNPELLTIPINVRGKSLGVLNIRQAGRNRTWSNSEIHVYRSIVDRISFALENARLYQDAQRRASKERVISEIATKVSSSVNMDNILQTAVEELGRVLPGSEVVIQFEQEADETGA